ncbi:hypothetical protein CAP38_00890 [Hydrogenophaga sp. IBVHS2]|nr:hypothetical protein CAP38_00890 [Hydrogenophaga sp. IBVHS2]
MHLIARAGWYTNGDVSGMESEAGLQLLHSVEVIFVAEDDLHAGCKLLEGTNREAKILGFTLLRQ